MACELLKQLHLLYLLFTIDYQLCVGSFWQACTWTHLLNHGEGQLSGEA